MRFLYWLEGIRSPLLDALAQLVTHLGGEFVFMAAAIIVFWCVSKRCGYFMLTVGFAGTLINQFLKLLFAVPRPWIRDPLFTIVESARAGAAGYSFPSGHAQNAFAALGAPAMFAKKKVVRFALFFGVAAVAFSRMYLGVHTLVDVGASVLIGAGLVIAFFPVFRDMDHRPGRMTALCFVFTSLAAAYIPFAPRFASGDPQELALGVKNGWIMLFCGAALIIVWYSDSNRLKFPVTAPLWAQIVKVCAGFGIILLIRSGLKQPLHDLFGGSGLSDGVRYFFIIIFAGFIWPMTFRWFSQLPRACKNATRGRSRLESPSGCRKRSGLR